MRRDDIAEDETCKAHGVGSVLASACGWLAPKQLHDPKLPNGLFVVSARDAVWRLPAMVSMPPEI